MKKVAIIGAGQVAEKVHAAYYRLRPDVLKLCAVVDTSIDRAQAFCERTGFQHAYDSVEEMLSNEQPDIVSVCTPNRFHFEAVMAALNAGCAVMCEKPPAMTAEEAMAMSRCAETQQTVLAYDFQHRFSEEAQMLKRHIDLLGDIYYVEANALRRSGVPGWGNFIDKKAQGGGPLIDYGIHMLDVVLYLLEFPKVVRATAHSFQKIGTKKSSGKFGAWDPAKFTVEDAIFGTLELADGGIIRLNTSFALNIKEDTLLGARLCGDKAGASLYPGEIYTDVSGKLTMLKEQPPVDDNLHRKSMHSFVERVLGDDTRMIADGQQGYAIQRLIEALYQSAEAGEVVDL